jgi:hypothetical protein
VVAGWWLRGGGCGVVVAGWWWWLCVGEVVSTGHVFGFYYNSH